MPLYMQLRDELKKRIEEGEMKPGTVIMTEKDMCREYGISRYPVRQALSELVEEGYLTRSRGRGTFVSSQPPRSATPVKSKLLGLVLSSLGSGFLTEILEGFEKSAKKRGYLVAVCSSDGSSKQESRLLDSLLQVHASGMVVFPVERSSIGEKIDDIRKNGVYLGLLDRDAGIDDADFTGSDNEGGIYSAVRHLAMQGFNNVMFVSHKEDVSSVNQRLEGFLKAAEDFRLNVITHSTGEGNLSRKHSYRFLLNILPERIERLNMHKPFGIVAVNDGVALKCMELLEDAGFAIGCDAAVTGFDNNIESRYSKVPLTTVAQNGMLIGQTAADTAIDHIEGKSSYIRHITVPTQLVIRESCGEKAVADRSRTV